MGRYTLKVSIPGQGNYNVLVSDKGIVHEKVSLMAIDKYTLDKDPLFIMKELGFSSAVLKGQYKFYISYISKGQEKNLDVIFDDIHDLKKIASQDSRKINFDNPVLRKTIDKELMPLITNKKFIKFMNDHDLLTFKLNEWIYNYSNSVYGQDFCYEKIIEYASDYKQFRALVIGIELFKNPNHLNQEKNPVFDFQNIENKRPNYNEYMKSQLKDTKYLEDEIDLDYSFGLFSEEELRKYNEYIDSLPFEEDMEDRRK